MYPSVKVAARTFVNPTNSMFKKIAFVPIKSNECANVESDIYRVVKAKIEFLRIMTYY